MARACRCHTVGVVDSSDRLASDPSASERPFQTVIVGAGVAGLEATLALNDFAGERVRVTLLDPGDEFRYRPLTVREPFTGVAVASYPLGEIIAPGGAEIIHDGFKWLDPAQRVVHTDSGRELNYDAVLLAMGARAHPRFRNVLTIDVNRLGEQLAGVVAQLDAGQLHSVAFVVPSLPIWSLPAYELALMTATRAAERGFAMDVSVITPEDSPLAALGSGASRAVDELLTHCGVRTYMSAKSQIRDPHTVELYPSVGEVIADVVIALPELYAPAVPGVPTSAERGFITVDRQGAVRGLDRVYAAGDITDGPVKNGSLSAGRALVAAEAIAALAGIEVVPHEYVPILDVMLIGGPKPLFIRSRLLDKHGIDVEVSEEPLWSPTTKIHAHYLAPRLAALDERQPPPDAPPAPLVQAAGTPLR